MPELILASQSPRRRELLNAMGLKFNVVPSNFAEKLDDQRPSNLVAIDLALGKAMEITKIKKNAIIVASDTIVTHNGRQLEKPVNIAEARQTLTDLAGDINEVVSSLVVTWPSNNILLMGSKATKVKFKPLNKLAIEKYLATGDYKDKAGSYGLQSGAAPLVEYIDGDFDVVMGLSTKLLKNFLQLCNIESKVVKLDCPVPVL